MNKPYNGLGPISVWLVCFNILTQLLKIVLFTIILRVVVGTVSKTLMF